MPNPTTAFPSLMPAKLAAEHPPVTQARALVQDMYFTEVATVIRRIDARDSRGGFAPEEVYRDEVPVHITRVANQRGAFTQGSTSAVGHGPLTSAAAWFVHVPIGTGLQIRDEIRLRTNTSLRIVSADDESTWEVMETYRAVELGLNQ